MNKEFQAKKPPAVVPPPVSQSAHHTVEGEHEEAHEEHQTVGWLMGTAEVSLAAGGREGQVHGLPAWAGVPPQWLYR